MQGLSAVLQVHQRDLRFATKARRGQSYNLRYGSNVKKDELKVWRLGRRTKGGKTSYVQLEQEVHLESSMPFWSATVALRLRDKERLDQGVRLFPHRPNCF